MEVKLVILMIIGVVVCIYGFYTLANMPNEIMKNMEREVKEYINEENKKYKEKEELANGLKKWLFKQ